MYCHSPLIYPDVPDDLPSVRVSAFISNCSGDEFYHIDNTSFAVLDPPVDYFYDSFNAINWTVIIACSNCSSRESSYVYVISVVEEFSLVRVATVKCVL